MDDCTRTISTLHGMLSVFETQMRTVTAEKMALETKLSACEAAKQDSTAAAIGANAIWEKERQALKAQLDLETKKSTQLRDLNARLMYGLKSLKKENSDLKDHAASASQPAVAHEKTPLPFLPPSPSEFPSSTTMATSVTSLTKAASVTVNVQKERAQKRELEEGESKNTKYCGKRYCKNRPILISEAFLGSSSTAAIPNTSVNPLAKFIQLKPGQWRCLECRVLNEVTMAKCFTCGAASTPPVMPAKESAKTPLFNFSSSTTTPNPKETKTFAFSFGLTEKTGLATEAKPREMTPPNTGFAFRSSTTAESKPGFMSTNFESRSSVCGSESNAGGFGSTSAAALTTMFGNSASSAPALSPRFFEATTPASGFGASAHASGCGASTPASDFGASAPASGFGASAHASGCEASAPASDFGASAPASGFGAPGFGTSAAGTFGAFNGGFSIGTTPQHAKGKRTLKAKRLNRRAP